MYISVYPVVITMRNSNVYEERSLGIYADDQESEQSSQGGILSRIQSHLVGGGPGDGVESNGTFVRAQLRAQLAHDAWLISLALFLIMIIENQQFVDDPADFSVFNFIFEIVSAYGCVGISIGAPGQFYSFCGSWHVLSKLILCFVMLRGRHRGLPVAIDRAILLPGEEIELAEEDDGRSVVHSVHDFGMRRNADNRQNTTRKNSKSRTAGDRDCIDTFRAPILQA